MTSKWISVNDRFPEKDGYYLCTYISDGHRCYQDFWFPSMQNEFSTCNPVTHWMVLPENPDD